MKYTKSLNKSLKKVLGSILCCSLALAPTVSQFGASAQTSDGGLTQNSSGIKKLENTGINVKDYLDDSVAYKLSDNISSEQDISVIISAPVDPLLAVYKQKSVANSSKTIAEYVASAEGRRVEAGIRSEINKLRQRVKEASFNSSFGEEYSILLSGFEVVIKAKDYYKLRKLIGDDATVTVGEVYESCDSQVVENIVDIDENTGIFNSRDSKYDGSGTVVAVLDTGLDYTHTAFDPTSFTGEEVLDLNNLQGKLSDTQAASMVTGLKAEDVYINKKVPYAFDYADKDSDVYPIDSAHGTHVSGVIVGNDNVIRGVAPNAQLVSMKVFSDSQQGARTSWILSALQDCVVLGVDVINMSLGSSCGFSNVQDEEETQKVYDMVAEQGISLVAAASNDGSSFTGSAKNGNLGLTSNPDSDTVGAPSTYEASLSVASVSGTKTPYLKYGDSIIYFTEAADRSGEPKDFVNEILKNGEKEKTLEYVTIPGVGRTADYSGIDVNGKIALVRRGSNTFEEKVRIAQRMGAAGVIIFNNVSGKIAMTVGQANFPACSVSRDDGEMLAAQQSGKLTIATSQKAGPFMSDFSSWGPTPDLKIKPEITAHGGNIKSSVPGNDYDILSGTSMASPNQAGVTALIRQYVKDKFPEGTFTKSDLYQTYEQFVTARVNQIMMSTADVITGPNGLASAVRRQGAGLANLAKATATPAYVSTFDRDGKEMNKAKLEVGDDPSKTGVYTMSFAINNMGSGSLSYDVGAIVLTEGVSETLTVRGDTTVTEEGYALGASVTVTNVKDGSQNGNTVTVEGNKSAVVEVKITLTDEDKAYLDKSFSNGMYVEGFVTLTAKDGNTYNLNVPYLAFYGDWNQAPIFDLDYFETNPDELNKGIDEDQKTMADTVPTRAVGTLYNDYIVYLGSYPFVQNPSATPVTANRDYVSLSNQTGESGGVNGISGVWAGMLRGADHVDITITDDVTGELIFSKRELNIRKSYSSGSSMSPTPIDIDFNLEDYDLKNNTRYNVKLAAYTPYGDGGASVNKRNTFEFPFVTDFEAPTVTGCTFHTEVDATTKKTRLFANISIYDNHFSQAAAIGTVVGNETSGYAMTSFDKYVTPLYSSFNSEYTLTYELTDHIDDILNSYNKRSFIVEVFDYAQNDATYEITIPDELTEISTFLDLNGEAISELTLNPNEVYNADLKIASADGQGWKETVHFISDNPAVADVVNGKIIARGYNDRYAETDEEYNTATIYAYANNSTDIRTTLKVTVLKPGDSGYRVYDKPVTDSFRLTEYYVDKAYYFPNSESREIGQQGYTVKMSGSGHYLSFYPSEQVTVNYDLKAYFPDDVAIEYVSSNPNIVEVKEVDSEEFGKKCGQITAKAEGTASVTVRVVWKDGRSTYYSETISINVKNPFTTSAMYLTNYNGNGGEVVIPDDLGITEISQYAFSGYNSVPKDLENGDEITKEDPYATKFAPIGDNTITKVVIPEGVELIDRYAFANLTALEEVVLPKSLNKIQSYAFSNCLKLKKINLENVKFINEYAFNNCPIEEVDFSSLVALGNGAFAFDSEEVTAGSAGSQISATSVLKEVVLPQSAQSIGSRAFFNNVNLARITFNASSVKLGGEAFRNCTSLRSAVVNAPVIPSSAFEGCTQLRDVTLGRDVAVVGTAAFRNTKVRTFEVHPENEYFKSEGNCLTTKDGKTLILIAPECYTFKNENVTVVGEGALSGNTVITNIELPNVVEVMDSAFAGCTSLKVLKLGKLKHIGEGAFGYCVALEGTVGTSDFDTIQLDSTIKEIGGYAFTGTKITEVDLSALANLTIGEGAFSDCLYLATVTIGDNAIISDGAFTVTLDYDVVDGGTIVVDGERYESRYQNVKSDGELTTLTIGKNANIGEYAFAGQMLLKDVTLGEGAKIGDYAFYMNIAIEEIDLTGVTEIGSSAFSGGVTPLYAGVTSSGQFQSIMIADYIHFSMGLKGKISLPALTKLGGHAFAVNEHVTEVELGQKVTVIEDSAFAYCSSLETINLDNITKIGSVAFMNAKSLHDLDLSSVEVIGDMAFMSEFTVQDVEEGRTGIASVIFADGAIIGNNAFYGLEFLHSVTNLEKVAAIGTEAFAFSGIGETQVIDLSGLKYLGDYAFMGSAVTKVLFGEQLQFVGENPFLGCEIDNFTEEKGLTTFMAGDNVFVENGVLYTYAPNGGIVLVSYPMLKADTSFTVKEGTIRISASAFRGNEKLVKAELPYSLKAIGDKAFYQCDALTVVVFNSVSAPILEEQYDENYHLISNLPLTGYYGQQDDIEAYKGLGIVPYYMWNLRLSSYFYGANFVNYIGKQDKPLIFVTPSNGEYYETFIYSNYYTDRVNGAVAPYENTLKAIEAISALSDLITLDDEAAVVAARALYDSLSSLEQQALVTNYSKLTSAESTISYLKNNTTPVTPENPPAEDEKGCGCAGDMGFGLTLGAGVLVMAAVVVALKVMQKKRRSK